MTLHELQTKLVDTNGWVSKKKLYKTLIKLGLLYIFLAMSVGLVAASVLKTSIAFVTILIVLLGYIWTLDYCVESEDNMKHVSRISNFWFVALLITVVLYFVLKYFNFI